MNVTINSRSQLNFPREVRNGNDDINGGNGSNNITRRRLLLTSNQLTRSKSKEECSGEFETEESRRHLLNGGIDIGGVISDDRVTDVHK